MIIRLLPELQSTFVAIRRQIAKAPFGQQLISRTAMGCNPYTDGFLVLQSLFRAKWLFQTTWSDRKSLADHFRRMACYFDAAPFKIRRNVFKWNQSKQGKAVVGDTHSYVVQIAAWFLGFIQRNYVYGWSLWNDLLIDYMWLKNSFLIKHLVIFLRNQGSQP